MRSPTKMPGTVPQSDTVAATSQDGEIGHTTAIVEEWDEREYSSLSLDPVASRAAGQRSAIKQGA